ncbi:MAG: GC-type dockerin domain-anchored protein [Phycisphaerales bacterium JB059]
MAVIACAAAPALAQPVLYEESKMYSPNPDFDRYFGARIDMDNGIMIVAAAPPSPFKTGSGVAYLYDTATGQLLHDLVPDEAYRFFPQVAIEGNIAVLGAPEQGAGAVYLFDVTTGEQIGTIPSPDAWPDSMFGYPVKIDDGKLAVGASGAGSDFGGRVYLFDLETRALLREFAPDNLRRYEGFGHSLAFKDGYLAAGTQDFVADYYEPGDDSVYIFNAETGEQLHEIFPLEPSMFPAVSMAINNDTLVIGTTGDGAPVIDIPSGDEILRLDPPGLSPSYDTLYDVQMNDDFIVVGAPHDRVDGLMLAGRVFVYDASTLELYTTLRAEAPGEFNRFGDSIGLEGRSMAIGAIWADGPGGQHRGGAVYRIDLDGCTLADGAEPYAQLDFSDVIAFLSSFDAMSVEADLAPPYGDFDFSDILAFLTDFATGCP